MAEDTMLREAIEAVQQGQRERARSLLTRLLRADQANPTYWLWMSSLVESPKERIFCLQNVLRLDPDNRAAKRGLVLAGALAPSEDVQPSPLKRRKWAVVESALPPQSRWQAFFENRILRFLAFTGTGLLITGLLLLGIFGIRSPRVGLYASLTVTPIPSTPRPSATLLPTNTPWMHTATPTFTGPTPLWMMLAATYTPTPLYVNTPHPISEAYRAGMRSFLRGDLDSMITFLEQAAAIEPEAADVHFYLAEANRLMGNLEKALAIYDRIITANPAFAPAYLGRARLLSTLNPHADVAADLEQAIRNDPALAEAYLERASFRLRQGEFLAALEDLETALEALPESPLVHLYKAQIYLALQENTQALEEAQQAHEWDNTLLPAYLALGQAYLQTGGPEQAAHFLQIYTLYDTESSLAYLALGQAIYESDQDPQPALAAVDRALQLDENLFEAHLFRGQVHLAVEDGQAAVNDFVAARLLDPDSFAASLGLARALFLAGRLDHALGQYKLTENLAAEDNQLAELYYWRALAYEAHGKDEPAIVDWQALLQLLEPLPAGGPSLAWHRTAQEHLATLLPPPSPTPTATRTITPKPTTTPTLTRTATSTPTAASTITRTATPVKSTPTSTPSPTAGGSALSTPTPTPRR